MLKKHYMWKILHSYSCSCLVTFWFWTNTFLIIHHAPWPHPALICFPDMRIDAKLRTFADILDINCGHIRPKKCFIKMWTKRSTSYKEETHIGSRKFEFLFKSSINICYHSYYCDPHSLEKWRYFIFLKSGLQKLSVFSFVCVLLK